MHVCMHSLLYEYSYLIPVLVPGQARPQLCTGHRYEYIRYESYESSTRTEYLVYEVPRTEEKRIRYAKRISILLVYLVHTIITILALL